VTRRGGSLTVSPVANSELSVQLVYLTQHYAGQRPAAHLLKSTRSASTYRFRIPRRVQRLRRRRARDLERLDRQHSPLHPHHRRL